MIRAADDYSAIADRQRELNTASADDQREFQRELNRPTPTRCTCATNGRWVHRGDVQMLLPDPNCALHSIAARPVPGGLVAGGRVGFLDLSDVDFSGLCSEADLDAGRGR